MSKHTPGPWTFDKAHRFGFVVHEKNYGYIVGAQDEEGRYGAIESEANARLIAAAPDNYECNVELAAIVRELCAAYGHPFPQASLDRSDAAIAKTRGEA